MKTFADSAGRTWTVSLTLDSVKRVRDLLGVNLLELDQGEPPLLTRIGTDVILLCDMIFAILKPQADAAGVSDAEFGAALGGEVIMAAQKAFYEELVGFFRQLGRGDLARAVEAQQRMILLAVAAVERRIEGVDVEGEIEKTLGSWSGSSPASSGSTPGR
jgi:hypothetical protein